MDRQTLTLITIATGLFGVLAAHRLNDSRSKRSVLRSAVQKYKAAFAPELSAVANNAFSLDTFSSAFNRHKDAVDTIRPILPKRYQRKLQKTWDDYCGIDSEYEDIGFDTEEFVSAMSASFVSTNDDLFDEFKENFNNLHGCLDKLLK